MKKLALLLTLVLSTAMSAQAIEPLLLAPLTNYGNTTAYTNTNTATAATQQGYNATFIPASKVSTDPNMVPQNNAAKGLPVPATTEPRIYIETKQGTQTNTQWNPGGKGTKSFF